LRWGEEEEEEGEEEEQEQEQEQGMGGWLAGEVSCSLFLWIIKPRPNGRWS